jgi:hypothetical protein
MYEQVEKPKEKKSIPVANSVTQKKGNGKPGFGFVDNRPLSVAQRKHQEISNDSQVNILQFGGKKVPKLTVKIPRPGFIGSVNAMREDAKDMYPGDSIHMAHRLSWQSIEDTVRTGNVSAINSMIDKLTIPQRDFGDPSNGGVSAGNKDFYDAVDAVVKKYGLVTHEVAKALNSSPYNLRPGHGPTNSAIGGAPDPHFDETKPGEPMTPQSKSLLNPTNDDSSDFMTMASFKDWETNFYDDYVLPAITSVKKI